MNTYIVELTKNDIFLSTEIIRNSFKTVADEFGLTKENCPTNGAFLEDGKLMDDYNRGIKMFGFFENTKQVGFMALERNDINAFYLEKLAVSPDYRHKGYGRMLMDYAKDYIKKANGNNISIGVIYENKKLLKWYEAYGFFITGTKQFSHLPFVVCFMRLDLC